MAIRTKAARQNGSTEIVRMVRVTEKNVEELATWINRHGGSATTGGKRIVDGRLRPAHVRLKQLNVGDGWSKVDWRVAVPGDVIVKFDTGEIFRIKEDIYASKWSAA